MQKLHLRARLYTGYKTPWAYNEYIFLHVVRSFLGGLKNPTKFLSQHPETLARNDFHITPFHDQALHDHSITTLRGRRETSFRDDYGGHPPQLRLNRQSILLECHVGAKSLPLRSCKRQLPKPPQGRC